MSGDPYWSSVKLLLGFNGTDGATSTSDESGAAHGAPDFFGTAQLDTAQFKFGTSSLLVDGSGSWLRYLDADDWYFGTGQFTVEGWFRFNATPANATLVTQWTTGGWALWFAGGALYFVDGNGVETGKYTWSPTLNTWYHIAIDRDASNVARIYVDGAMVVKTTYGGNIPDGNGFLTIGSLRPYFTGYDLNGWVDEIRITKDVARYASDSGFAVPTAAFERGAFSATGPIKVWSGSAWVEKPAKVWSGSAWVTKTVRKWTGSAWNPAPAPAGPTSTLLSAFTPGTDRNDFTGQVGVRLGIGGSPFTITWCGARRHSSGQTGVHTVKLYEWFADALQWTANIDYTGIAVGSWAWTAVPSTTLPAGSYYALMFDVVASDGQTWCNPGAATYTGMANVYDCYRVPASALATGTPNDCFIGLDLGW